MNQYNKVYMFLYNIAVAPVPIHIIYLMLFT